MENSKRTTIRVLSYSTTAAQENQRPCREKTKVYTETVGNADCCALRPGFESRSCKSMDASKCIVPLRHEDTLNRRRGESPLVRLVEGP
ncbi:hypothetical protein TNCV_2222181 [Trichonephila clavipes]|nr:hypothetical protein TNCV_2222181 [Trichonephila clavipes]